MRLFARIISRIFDPVIIIPLILAGTVSLAYLNGFRWRFFALIFFLDAVVPGLVFIYLLLRRGISEWDIRDRKQRLPLFAVTIFCHGVGVAVSFLLDRHPLAEILLILWLMSIVYFVITHHWKVSIHAGVNATLATMVYWFVSTTYWWVWLVPVAVSIARIIDHNHTPWQVTIGLVIPPVMLSGLFYLFNVI